MNSTEQNSFAKYFSIEDAINMLGLLKYKQQESGGGWVRLLDSYEFSQCEPGKIITVQVLSYFNYEFVPVTLNRTLGIVAANRFVRRELGYDGPIRLAVAA